MASHFYTPNGECLLGLREARKYNALPSPTTILKTISSPALHKYWQAQLFTACQLTERKPGMLDDEYREAVIKASEEHAVKAREIGTKFHDWVSLLNLSFPTIPTEKVEGMEGQCELVAQWYSDNIAEVLMQETPVRGDGYVGKMDLCVRLKDGSVEVVDTKTQGLKGKRKTFNHYFTWALQLGAYAGAVKRIGINVTKVRSLVVSSDLPALFESYEWPQPPSTYHRLFMAVKEIWNYENNYFPDEEKMCNVGDVVMKETKQKQQQQMKEYLV